MKISKSNISLLLGVFSWIVFAAYYVFFVFSLNINNVSGILYLIFLFLTILAVLSIIISITGSILSTFSFLRKQQTLKMTVISLIVNISHSIAYLIIFYYLMMIIGPNV